jgi:hypothetical protein
MPLEPVKALQRLGCSIATAAMVMTVHDAFIAQRKTIAGSVFSCVCAVNVPCVAPQRYGA